MKQYKILALMLIGVVFGSAITLLIKPLQAAPSTTSSGDTRGGYLSNLSKANLSGFKDMNYHNFTGFNFSGTNLQYSSLRYSNFSRANLSGANLSCADLTGANLTTANLTDVVWTDQQKGCLDGTPTTCPDGTCINYLYESGECVRDDITKNCKTDPNCNSNNSCDGHLVITPTP